MFTWLRVRFFFLKKRKTELHLKSAVEVLRYLALVLSQLDPWSLGLTSLPNVAGVRSCSSQRPVRRMLTDRLLAHMRMQGSSPSCTQREHTGMKAEQQPDSNQTLASRLLKKRGSLDVTSAVYSFSSSLMQKKV